MDSSQITFSDQNISELMNGPNGGCPPIYDCDIEETEVKKQEYAGETKKKGSVGIADIIRERRDKAKKKFFELSTDKDVAQEETDME
jgi:hypothetical protein